jgi:hypothetical protein
MQFQLKRIEMHCSDMEQALLSLSKGTEYGEHLYEDLQVLGDRIELLVKDPSRAIAGVNECLTESSVQVHSMQVKELTMENVFFLHLAGSKEPIPGNGSGLQQIRNYANCETLIDADRSRDRGRPARFLQTSSSDPDHGNGFWQFAGGTPAIPGHLLFNIFGSRVGTAVMAKSRLKWWTPREGRPISFDPQRVSPNGAY